ncbi:MAG: hypothetical protein CK425_01275 [Parachlamydia sp.]|nr:MAG: hypothetical protein CK425_01275 [Parachlamydia sp.]
MKSYRRFLSLLVITCTLSNASLLASETLLDFSDIEEKDAEMVSSLAALARNEAATEAYEFTYEGQEFIVYPHVYSPKIFPSTFFYINYMDITPGQSFLEIGSGTGILALTAALRGANPVVATDLSPIAVANTTENIHRYGLNEVIDAREGSVFDPIKEGETFDTILWNVPYMHIDKTDLSPIEMALYDPCYKALTRFFAEAKKYLKPNGKLWFGSSATHMHQDVLQKLVDTYGWSLRVIAEKTVTLPPIEGGAPAINVQLCEAMPIPS